MQIKKAGISLILSCLFSLNLFAQSTYQNFVPNVFGKSPTSASFTKYGDYPTNLYSGLPEISIPLYTIESGGLKVPITLSYHASGIKVEQAATWVGLGWTLGAGGAVSRTVYGAPDDVMGYFYNYKRHYDPENDDDVHALYNAAVSKSNDTRPDVFSYSFPGHDGKFFFNALESYKVKTIPYSPISIKNTAVHIGYDTAKFSIADEHGNAYRFGYQYREITTALTTSSRPASNSTTSWMLESMVSQNKHDTIRFTYRSQINQLPDATGQSLAVEDQDNGTAQSGGPHPYAINNWLAFTSNSTTTVNEQDPREIFFKNGKVVFKISNVARTDLNGTNPYPLDTIQVFMYDFSLRQYESRPQKSIVFKRSYYSVMSGSQGRLRLDGIQVLDKAGSVVQEYKFTYNTTPLPVYSSYSKDLWGYYNGKMDNPAITNKTLIPRMKITVEPSIAVPTPPYDRYIGSDDSTSRYPDTTKMQAGVLTRVDYPTGGYTNFNYETNRYVDDSLRTRFTGGLRIASIASYSSATATTPILKTYKYNVAVPNFVASGGFINYGFFMNNNQVAYVSGGIYQEAKRVRTFYSESSNSLTSTDGNPVAYKTVTEYIGDPITNIGKTVYSYRHNGDFFEGSTGSAGIPITVDYFYARGQLASKTDYTRKSDGTYQIARSETNTYSAFADSTYEDVGVIVGQRRQSELSLGGPTLYLNSVHNDDRYSYPYSLYYIRSGDSYLTSTTTNIYDQADPTKYQSSTVEYKYDNFKHQQVSRIRTIDSKGDTKVTFSKYPADYLAGVATSTNNTLLDSMLSKNMQAELIEKWDSVTNAATGVSGVAGGQLNLYQFNGAPVVPYQIKKLTITSPLTNFIPAYVLSGNITADSRYLQMIEFNFDYNKNLVQYTPKNAGPTSIIWDYNNALPIAQVANDQLKVSYNSSAYTSFEADGKGNFDFASAEITDINAPTGKMVHQLSGAPVYMYNAALSKPHIVSYWSDNGAASVTISGISYTGTALKTYNGYTLYEHAIPALSNPLNITISGNSNIDELKTYPSEAQMTTYAYDTNGITHMADAKDMITTYQYDEAQRLMTIKDWQGNIVKNYDYHNYNMTVGNDAIAATTFTRNNCPPNTAPGSTTYSVAANKHYSSTKESANALAQYDLKTNGQLKANDPAICGCTILYVTFTATNSTGISTYQANFTGPNTIYMPINATGSTTKPIPAGTYSIQVGGVGTAIKTFSLGGTTITGRTATFTNVVIQPGSSSLTLSIN